MIKQSALLLIFISLARVATAADPPENSPGVHVGLIRFDLSSVYDTNIDHETIPQEDYGVVAGGQFRLQSQPANPLAWAEYRGEIRAYAITDQWDRISHRFRLGMGRAVGRLDLGVFGELSTRTSTEDRELVNQFTVSPGATIAGSNSRRLHLYGAYRFKRYLSVVGEDETIWFAGVKARTGTWRTASLELEYRYEASDAENPVDTYTRHRVEGEFEQRLGRRNRVRASLAYRIRQYPEDYLADGAFREDRRWIPGLRWTHRLTRGQQLLLDYQYQIRHSNEPDEEYEAHRVTFSVRWPIIR